MEQEEAGVFLWEVDVKNDGNFVPFTDWIPVLQFDAPGLYPARLRILEGTVCEKNISFWIDARANCNVATHDLPAIAIQVFPNPSQDHFFCRLGPAFTDSDWVLEVYDTHGQLQNIQASRRQESDWYWDTSDWAEGLYFLRGQNEKGLQFNQRIIVLH